MSKAGALGLALAVALPCVFAAPAQAKRKPASPVGEMAQGWLRIDGKDEVADAKVVGARFQSGDDRLLLVCREEKGEHAFIVRWLTSYKLGRGGAREVVYRFDQQPPITEDWTYTSRNAEPPASSLLFHPSQRFARRLAESTTAQMLFRLRSRDGEAHDIAVPLDDAARAAVRAALERCA